MADLKTALSKATGVTIPAPTAVRQPLSPSNPCPHSIKRVTNPLPIPTKCLHCGEEVVVVPNSEIYGESYGDWPWAYLCSGDTCDAYVGMHPRTNIPLGTLATYAMRQARMKAKKPFNELWQTGFMTRKQAYQWLAAQMNIRNYEECHIGWFDVQQCERVYELASAKMTEMINSQYGYLYGKK